MADDVVLGEIQAEKRERQPSEADDRQGGCSVSLMNKKLLPLVYATFALFIFVAQSYYLYFEFLPVNLAAYASAPDIQGHIKKMLDVMFGPAIFWFVLLEASIVGYAIVMYVKARRDTDIGP